VTDAVLAGLLAGYGIAIPVGAVAAYLITLGAAHGFATAASGGLGAASVDALYAAVAVVLGAVLAPLIMAVGAPLRWVAAAVLVNPATVVYFAALVGGSTVIFTSPIDAVAFVVAAGVASVSWQLLLAGAGAGLGRVLTGPVARRWTAVVGAVVVLALAILTVIGV